MARYRIGLLSSYTVLAIATATASVGAGAEPPTAVEIFAAGSLRGVVSDLAAAVGPAFDISVKPNFGGSGSLRERVEHGEHPDLLLSADLGSPRKLESAGRTFIPATAFARNRMCIVSLRTSGLTAANLIDHLVTRGVRVKTSTPVADPGGDYAWAIFEGIEKLRPGSGALLKEKALTLMDVVATPTAADQSAAAALFASGRIDVSITYCSAAAGLERELPELTSLVVPPALDPHPTYGLAVLSDKPAALKVALFLLSEKGQEIIAKNGLVPLLDRVVPENR